MKTKHIVSCVLAILLGSALGSLVLSRLMRSSDSSEPQGVQTGRIEEPNARGDGELDGLIRLTPEQVQRFGVETAMAGPGELTVDVSLPGEIAINADRIAHLVPRVGGVVREVGKNLGDTVRGGEVVAVLESRDLAEGTAALLAARERVILARSNFDREERLWSRKISAEQDYIQAKNALAEASIELRAAEQNMRALGFSDAQVADLAERKDSETLRYEITAPFDATVIEKHISLGEAVQDDSELFVIADLSSVWVNLDVHQKDLPSIRVGQKATISASGSLPDGEGLVTFIEPTAHETARTVHARVTLANSGGRWAPGLFVTGRIAVDRIQVPVRVPTQSIVTVDGRACVFVQTTDGYLLREVTSGRSDQEYTEIARGLVPGEVYVAKGAFTLKSELEKPEVED